MKLLISFVCASLIQGCAADGSVNWNAVSAVGITALGTAAVIESARPQIIYYPSPPICWLNRWGYEVCR